MPKHYNRTTKAVTRWCPTCGRATLHTTRPGMLRIQRCMQHEPPALTQKQRQRAASRTD